MGGSTTVNLLHRWTPLEAVVLFGGSAATVTLAWVLSVMGCKGFGQEQEEGEKSVHGGYVDRVTGLTTIF